MIRHPAAKIFFRRPKTLALYGFFASLLVLFGALQASSAASEISVQPVVIDAKAEARDVIPGAFTLKNNATKQLDVNTFVFNLDNVTGGLDFTDPSRADWSRSLANWITVGRGTIPLRSGEERQIDFTVEVNARAVPGVYHAVIVFADGKTRDEAAAKLETAPRVTVNFEVEEKKIVKAQLKRFAPTKTFFLSFPVSFDYEMENIGNQDVTPQGEIRIYDRTGKEIGTVETPRDLGALSSGMSTSLLSAWNGTAGIGRYKAVLDLRYGPEGEGALQDTVFFWLVPWQKIVIVFFSLAVLLVVATLMLHRFYEKRGAAAREETRREYRPMKLGLPGRRPRQKVDEDEEAESVLDLRDPKNHRTRGNLKL